MHGGFPAYDAPLLLSPPQFGALISDRAEFVSRDHRLLVGRNYQDFNLAVWRADPRGMILIVLRVNFDAQPFELIANHLPDLKGVFTRAGGEHEAVQSSPVLLGQQSSRRFSSRSGGRL